MALRASTSVIAGCCGSGRGRIERSVGLSSESLMDGSPQLRHHVGPRGSGSVNRIDVSDRGTLGGLTQFLRTSHSRQRRTHNANEIEHAGPAPFDCGRYAAYILIAIREIEGCSGLRCRQLDGRAAILVVARPGGFDLGRPGPWTARTPCVCRPDATTRSRDGTPESRSDDWRGSSPRGTRRRFHSTSRLIAGTSRLHDPLLQPGGHFVGRLGCAPEARCSSRPRSHCSSCGCLECSVSTAWGPRARLSAGRTDASVAGRAQGAGSCLAAPGIQRNNN